MKLWTDGRTTDGRTTEPAYTISSPGAFGSGELKSSKTESYHLKNPQLCNLRLFSFLKILLAFRERERERERERTNTHSVLVLILLILLSGIFHGVDK